LKKLVVRCKKNEAYKGYTLTDQNVMYGLSIYKACKKYFAINGLLVMTIDIRGIINKQQNYPLILLAQEIMAGYKISYEWIQ